MAYKHTNKELRNALDIASAWIETQAVSIRKQHGIILDLREKNEILAAKLSRARGQLRNIYIKRAKASLSKDIPHA